MTPDGQPYWADAAMFPHLLIGGHTDGGKSAAIAALVGSLCVTQPPGALSLALMDPKGGGEFG